MSVISFDDEGEVWGASRRFIYAMIGFFIETAGPKDYLKAFKQSYDHGYNAIFLERVTFAELLEFRDLVEKYLSSGEFLIRTKVDEDRGRELLGQLIEMTDASIMKRRPL